MRRASSRRIQTFITGSGERYCLLIDRESGFPLYHPNLYVTTQVRNRSLSLAAMESALTAINVLLIFCDEHNIDLSARFLKRQFLVLHEIEAIGDLSQKLLVSLRTPKKPTSVLPFAKERNQRRNVGLATEYVRLTYIANYCKWLADVLLPRRDRETAKSIDAMKKALDSRRPIRRGRNQLKNEMGLDEVQLEILFEVLRPASEFNPFRGLNLGVRVRNRLIVLMLLYLGCRGGELLNIRGSEIDPGSNQIIIARRADEIDDPRVDQPRAKTLDRRVPMNDVLALEIRRYTDDFRRHVPNARRNDYLFIVHKPGPTQGQPLSISAYQKIIRTIVSAAPDKLRDLHGHALRHAWNRRFSEHMDRMDHPPEPEAQESLRSYLQGWKQNSGTAAAYNRRFVEAKAIEHSLKLQDGMARIPESLKKEVEYEEYEQDEL